MYELPKENIIRNKFEFNKVYSKGHSYVNHLMVIHVINSDNIKGKIGFAVGKKIGNAVVRNYYKRVIRNICDKNKNLYSNNKDYIIIMRKGLVSLNYSEANASFIDLIKKIN